MKLLSRALDYIAFFLIFIFYMVYNLLGMDEE